MPQRQGFIAATSLDFGGIGDPVIGPCNDAFAGLERLAQRVQRLRREFRKFVEKQHAVMGKRRLPPVAPGARRPTSAAIVAEWWGVR